MSTTVPITLITFIIFVGHRLLLLMLLLMLSVTTRLNSAVVLSKPVRYYYMLLELASQTLKSPRCVAYYNAIDTRFTLAIINAV